MSLTSKSAMSPATSRQHDRSQSPSRSCTDTRTAGTCCGAAECCDRGNADAADDTVDCPGAAAKDAALEGDTGIELAATDQLQATTLLDCTVNFSRH